MTDTLGILSDEAGIIPRALHALFKKLEADETESSVKCSFIELYNEELRDLISPDENSKLKIFDDNSKKGHSSTLVQGMEETHIKSATEGVKLLRKGSHKRQVAATKCNDLSSRSHTVFTVTVYVKSSGDNGEDYVSAGKLNLVDLAGSENIQRSGAENKRAAEAGLINKSLLTLGRVINALVDRSQHIPYRESKLTRLLQDSLGGQTKTCIIATVSPAKSNLEETISTLDYAFRAKNIRNKPQVNQLINKKTLLREFTSEIERLKSELIVARQRNGVYLSNENYEELTTESESRRILSEEQAAKIETMEANLRNKVQELFSLTSNLMTLRKDNDAAKVVLDETQGVLDQTEFVLTNTKQSLAEEAMLRKAHEETEAKLSKVGSELISTLGRTVHDVSGMHDKSRRKSDLQSLNRNTWGLSQAQVSEVTSLVESRVDEFRIQQQEVVAALSERMSSFVGAELEKLSSTQSFLGAKASSLEASEEEVSERAVSAKEEMDAVLEEIKTLREDVKTRIGQGLQALSMAAERISAEVVGELGVMHAQLHSSYSALGRDFKSLFEDLLRHINEQKVEADELRKELHVASELALQSNAKAAARLGQVLEEERQQAALDRQNLLSQITSLVTAQGEAQDQRLSAKIGDVQKDVLSSKEQFETSRAEYTTNMNAWNEKEEELIKGLCASRDALKTKLKDDWTVSKSTIKSDIFSNCIQAANDHTSALQASTRSVHEETVRIVDLQMTDISIQMQALDDFVTRARSQNAQHNDSHLESLRGLSAHVRSSYSNIGAHFASSYERIHSLGEEMAAKTALIENSLEPLDATINQPLAELRSIVLNTALQEYQPTGDTPQKVLYQYPMELPRTEAHDTLLAVLRQPTNTSPSKTTTIPVIFNDGPDERDEDSMAVEEDERRIAPAPAPTLGLREIDININAGSPLTKEGAETVKASQQQIQSAHPGKDSLGRIPSFKRSGSVGRTGMPRSARKTATIPVVALEGRENAVVAAFSQSAGSGRRRSPRGLVGLGS